MKPFVLHSFWRSSASYRVRIGLNIKGLDYEQVTHDLRTFAQKDPAYVAIAPQGMVPALEVDEWVITQSSAILEWVEERYPTPPLLPATALDRAIVRSMSAIIGADIQPTANFRIFNALRGDFGATQDQIDHWVETWMNAGFHALEAAVAIHGGKYCFGDSFTMADCYLVPQVYSAVRFGVDMTRFPLLSEIMDRASSLDAVARAHPGVQPDADPA